MGSNEDVADSYDMYKTKRNNFVSEGGCHLKKQMQGINEIYNLMSY